MKRWRARFLICLLLGAVSTVGVAWTLALTMPLLDWSASRMPPIGKDAPRWYIGYRRGPGALNILAMAGWELNSPPVIDEFQVPGWSRAAHPPTAAEVEGVRVFFEQARGWPMLSLYRRETNERASRPLTRRTEWGWEIESLRHFTKDPRSRTVPLAVIWPGFLINTLLYGAPWFGLLLVPGAARRAIRRKRGRCVNCAYDLRGDLDAGCPECGWGRTGSES